MARISVVGDTKIPATKALEFSGPLTPSDTIPQYQLGKTGPKFAERRIPQPDRTAKDPDVAPRSGPPITGGKRGSVGNPIGDAIGKAAKLFSPLIADAFAPLPTGVPGMTTSDIPANTNFFSPVTDAIGFTSPPVGSDFNASLAAMKDGGFIRRRG